MSVALAPLVVADVGESELDAVLDGAGDVLPEAALAAVRAPICEIALALDDRTGSAWVGPAWCLLSVPLDDGRRRVHAGPTDWLPILLARLNGLQPRPRQKAEHGLRLDAAGLAQALAGGVADPRVDELLRTRVGHWRATARWSAPAGAPSTRTIEVIDCLTGLWRVSATGDQVELEPTTPTAVWRELVGLLPSDQELA
jgi:hypothetical protein